MPRTHIKKTNKTGVVANACNSNTGKAETYECPGLPGYPVEPQRGWGGGRGYKTMRNSIAIKGCSL